MWNDKSITAQKPFLFLGIIPLSFPDPQTTAALFSAIVAWFALTLLKLCKLYTIYSHERLSFSAYWFWSLSMLCHGLFCCWVIIHFLLYVSMERVYVCVLRMCHSVHVEVGGQFYGVISCFLLLYEFQEVELDSKHLYQLSHPPSHSLCIYC